MNLKSSLKILGIDPGSTRIGFGLIEKNKGGLIFKKTGVIEIIAKDTGTKLIELAHKFKKILIEFKPDVIGIEKIFFTKNIKTGIAVAEARGVLMYTSSAYLKKLNSISHTLSPASRILYPLFEFTPQQIKQITTNYGGADKKAVARMVARLLNIPPLTILDDATDALAIAIAAAYQNTSLNQP